MAATRKCDVTSINVAAKCFSCLSQKENQALICFFLAQRLALLSGAAQLTPNQLRSQVACLACVATDPVADNLDAAVAQDGALAAGAAQLTTKQARALSNQFANMSLDDLRTIEIFLRCQLNQFP